MLRNLICSAALLLAGCASQALGAATNPIIWADVPDVSVVRVDDTYYMVSTTMHMSPGQPIMASKDLVDWKIVSYTHDILADNDALNMQNGRNAYSRGTWASSIRYHDGYVIATTFSNTTGKTYIFRTRDVESGEWERIEFEPMLHDHSLFFDDDGRVYMLYGNNDIRIVELKEDLTGLKEGGINQVAIPNGSKVVSDSPVLFEGTQVWKVNGKYYVFNITWPRGGMRTVVVHRSDNITGPYEGRVVLQDRGIAQGGIVDTPDGKWYAYMFQDAGAVGRMPYLMPMTWSEDGWPVLGIDGKVPDVLEELPADPDGLQGIVTSDEFERAEGDRPLPLEWQWNHNPDNDNWSLTARPGWLRLTTGRVDENIEQARNTLTQRTFGPHSSASTLLDASGLKDGDYAGLTAFTSRYGFVGVKRDGDALSIVNVLAPDRRPREVASVPLEQDHVYLRIDCDFERRNDKAYFYYSLDGENWTRIGETLQMVYNLEHFMGYRFGLFTFATKEAGGHADFDFYHVGTELLPVE